MPDVIDLLDRIGQDASLRRATRAEIETALNQSGVDAALQDMLFRPDTSPLKNLLGANSDMCCLIRTPDEEDDEDEDDGDDGDDAPDDDKEVRGRFSS